MDFLPTAPQLVLRSLRGNLAGVQSEPPVTQWLGPLGSLLRYLPSALRSYAERGDVSLPAILH